MSNTDTNTQSVAPQPGNSNSLVGLVHLANGTIMPAPALSTISPRFEYIESPVLHPASASNDDYIVETRRAVHIYYELHLKKPKSDPVLLSVNTVMLSPDRNTLKDSAAFASMSKNTKHTVADLEAKMKNYLRQKESRPTPRPLLVGTDMGPATATAPEQTTDDEVKERRYAKRFRSISRKIARASQSFDCPDLNSLIKHLQKTVGGEDENQLQQDIAKIADTMHTAASDSLIATY